MGKVKHLFSCSECGRPAAQWSGRCAGCGRWGTVAEETVVGARAGRRAAGASRVGPLALDRDEARIETGFPGVDRVLGGGLVPGSVVLLAGAPGIGKSTLVLQLAARVTASGRSCLLACGEEARGQVASRARRLGLELAGISFMPGRDLEEVVEAALAMRPDVLVVDSIHTVRGAEAEGAPGGPAQVRACVDALVGAAKEHAVTTLLVGHVTKAGDLAGPRTVEHAVDAVLTFEGDPGSGLRVLAGGKNRFGLEGEMAWFEMGSAGLSEREAVHLSGEGDGDVGCAIALTTAGRRAYAVEVQALMVPTDGPPRRQVSGLDARRFHIVAAVLDRSLGLRLVRSELFGATAGGVRLNDPATDLAVAASLASAASGVPPPRATGFVGEVALTGAVRPVGSIESRLAAAAGAGVRTLVCAAGEPEPARVPAGLAVRRVRHVREAVKWAI